MSTVATTTGSDRPELASQQQSSGDSGVTATQPIVACLACSSVIGRSAYSISCSKCSKPAHFSCLVNKYKKSGTGPVKCTLEWIHGLLQHIGLQYTCQCCTVAHGNPQATTQPRNSDCTKYICNEQPLHDEVVSLKSSLQAITGCVSQIAQQIIELKTLLHPTTQQMATDLSCHNVMTPSHAITLPKPSSSAAAVSGDITKLVKTAVCVSMRKQKIIERDNACIAVLKMREYGNDINDLRNLCEYLDCDVLIISATRIGQKAQSSKKIRVLKIQLQSASDKMKLLKSSKYLKEDRSTSAIFFTPWLSTVEMAKLRNIQSRCKQLNDGVPARKDGRKPYIVISGRLMERAVNGELCPACEDFDVASIIAANQPQPLQHTSPLLSQPVSSSVMTATVDASTSLSTDQQPSLQSKNGLGGSR